MISTAWHSEKDKVIKKVKYQWLPQAQWQKEKINSETQQCYGREIILYDTIMVHDTVMVDVWYYEFA